MGFFDWLFGLFGKKKSTPAPAPTPIPSQPRTQTPPSPPPPGPTPAPDAPAPMPPPISTPSLSLDALKLSDPTKLSAAQINDAATRLGVEPEAIRAIIDVESAGQGFAPDGRPLILFSPTIFSDLTGHQYDGGHPGVSQSSGPVSFGNTQADRWAKLKEAFGLDASAALQATNWGLFQISGHSFDAAGYPDVFTMVNDIAQSEARQLAAFEAFVRAKDLMDEFRTQDFAGFASAYHGAANAATYAKAAAAAYAKEKSAGGGASFVDGLVATNAAPLSAAEIEAAATRMSVEPACVRAVLKVESKGSGFASDGKPLILFEPHIFSRLTGHTYDATHPTVSYLNWKDRPYPGTQAGRYGQLKEAYALNAEAALSSASWGLFQIMGMNFAACGFTTATAFVSDMAHSEANMLKAFEAFVRKNNILDELQRKDWAGFARVYNGSGQVETYSALLQKAYDAAKATV